ncbi:hypothetical protein FF38_04204 [Lucilia cuprina]|uniref:Uncharacterized protein n=1 Tax=Lucilia cuprina TaxID=7375 RepID=A0A0L0C3N2_LUCCU|nr:hypothetical protein FF38_04204 [Lucilia cuprina]
MFSYACMHALATNHNTFISYLFMEIVFIIFKYLLEKFQYFLGIIIQWFFFACLVFYLNLFYFKDLTCEVGHVNNIWVYVEFLILYVFQQGLLLMFKRCALPRNYMPFLVVFFKVKEECDSVKCSADKGIQRSIDIVDDNFAKPTSISLWQR